jgi:hypothetical protein
MALLMQEREQECPSYSTDKGDSGAASHDVYFSSPVATHGDSASSIKERGGNVRQKDCSCRRHLHP